MKKIIILLSVALYIFSPADSQKIVTLESNITSSIDTSARDMIILDSGFEFSLTGGDSLCLNIDDQIIAGVEYENTGDLPDQNRSLDQSLEVGTTNGSFSVSGSGSAQYSIPINIPVGVRGMQPRLSVVYNQGGPGLLGYGFNLAGLSQISYTYPTKYNDDTYGSTDSKEYLSLDGQRLIKTTISSSTYYQPEYGSKSIIKEESSPQSFTQYNPDRSTVKYGETTNSRLSDSTGSWSFYITSISDEKGNNIKYSYLDKTDDSQVLLDKIEYFLSGSSTAYETVLFCYDDTIHESDTWGVKGRLIKYDHLLRKIKVLSNTGTDREYNFYYTRYQASGADPTQLYSYLYKIEEKDYSGKMYNPLIFTWEEKPVNSVDSAMILMCYTENKPLETLWSNRRYYSGDIDGDGDFELIGEELAASKDGMTDGTDTIDVIDGYSASGYRKIEIPPDYNSFLLGDFNGDGADEILWHDGKLSNYSRSHYKQSQYPSGSYLTDPQLLITSLNGSTLTHLDTINATGIAGDIDEIFVGDINGDFYSDIICITDANKLYVFSGGSENISNSWDYYKDLGGTGTAYIGDFNGDGKSDLLHFTVNWVRGYYLDSSEDISTFYSQALFTNVSNFNVGDFNGDGITDLAKFDHDTIFFGNGDGFSAVVTNTEDYGVANLNGDNKSDAIGCDDFSGLDELIIDSEFGSETFFTGPMESAHAYQLLFFDQNRDGCSDIFSHWSDYLSYSEINDIISNYRCIGFDDLSIESGKSYYVVLGGVKARDAEFVPQVLKTITNGLNKTITINYELQNKSPNSIRTHDGDSTFYNLLAPIPIVKSYTVDNGIGGTNTLSYSYSNALVHRKGKGFMGFSNVSMTDEARRIKTEKYFSNIIVASDQTEIISPHIDSLLLKTSGDTLISRTVNEMDVHKYSSKKHSFPFIDKTDFTNSLTGQTKTNRYQYTSESESGFKYSTLTSAVYDYTASKDSIRNTYDLTFSLVSDIYVLNQTNQELIKTRSGLSGEEKKYTTSFQYPSNSGLISSEISEPDNSNLKRIKAIQYDSYGNPSRIVDSVPSLSGRYINYEYDDTKRFITETSNAISHTNSATYTENGLPSTSTDANGLTTSHTYGSFNRITSTVFPDSSQTATSYDWATPGSGSAPANSVYKIVTTNAGQQPVTVYFDELGREIQNVHSGFSGETIYTDIKYNTKGQIDSVSLPYVSDSTPNWALNFFDSYSRKIEQRKLSDTVRWEYSGMKVTETKYGLSSEKTYGNDGLVSSVQDASNPQVSFTYNVAGLDSIITAPGSILTKFEYDHFGRKTKLVDPDAGTIKYFYNGYGDLSAQVNASDDSIAMMYDNLGRLTQKTEIDGDGTNPNRTVTLTYDTINGKGLVNRITVSGETSEKYNYDEVSRVSSKSITISGEASLITESYTYDEFGRIDSLTYPSGLQIAHGYNSYGYLDKISRTDNNDVIWEAKNYNELGMLEEFWLNKSSEKTYYDYDNNYLLSDIRTNRSWNIQDLDYIWNGSRHLLTSREDDRIGKTESFTYDALNRLTTWSVASGVSDTIVYLNDYSGRIDSKTNVGSYDFPSNSPYHAIEELTNVGSLVDTACHEISYTSFLKTKTLTHTHNQDSIRFYYGGGDQRYKKKVYDGSLISTTLYTHGNYEVITVEDTVRKLHYINTPTGLTAIYVDNSNTATDTMYYIHKDHIGSFNLITNDQDTTKSYLSFDPWGKRRHPTNWDTNNVPTSYIFDRGFTGHEHIDHFGMINMNGRMYDPALGMMLGPDKFVSQPFNTQNYNRYSYALNNPLLYTDPTGNFPSPNPEGSNHGTDPNSTPPWSTKDTRGRWYPGSSRNVGQGIWIDVYAYYSLDFGNTFHQGQLSYSVYIPTSYVSENSYYSPGTYRYANSNGEPINLPQTFGSKDQVLDPVQSIPGKVWHSLNHRLWTDPWGFTWEVDNNGQIIGLTPIAGLGTAGWLGGPSAAKLFKSALSLYKTTRLSNVGRGLTKHPDVIGFDNFNALTQSLRDPVAINQAASNALKNIMRNGTRSINYAPRLGQNVIQYTLPSGYGARWTIQGGWVGFITP